MTLIIRKGDRFNNLVIIEEVESKIIPSGKKQRVFKCKCDCGNIKDIRLAHINHGRSKSCGCVGKEKIRKLNLSHGLSTSRIYRIYKGLNNRCNYKKHPEFKYWGGKGIKNEWGSFESFLHDMQESYLRHCKSEGEKRTSIDRIDGNKNYCKENCRWATPSQQVANSKKNNGQRKIFEKDRDKIKEYLKEGLTGAEIGRRLGVWRSCIYANIKKYDLK